MSKKLFTFLLFIFGTALGAVAQSSSKDIIGTWLIADKTVKVRIEKVNNTLIGKPIWLKEPLDERGQPKTDINNKNEKERNRPIIGLNLFSKFVFDKDGDLSEGKIYSPKEGKTYSCKLSLKDKNTLLVRGYVGMKAFGKTEEWVRSQ